MRSSFVVLISSDSRRFQSARTSAEGAQPRMPGWIRPGKRTCGIWREEAKMPSKSQIALALLGLLSQRKTYDLNMSISTAYALG